LKIKKLKKMKSKILSIVTLLVVILGISQLTYAASGANANFTVVNEISRISKIEVHGNVELFVSDGSADQVKVYNHYYAESALVQSKDGVLRISSYAAEKLVVWVTANDLRSISAYDNADVKSFGKLSKIELDVDLHNNASAKLDLDAYVANVTLDDHSKVWLSGAADEFKLSHNITSWVNDYHLSVIHFTESKTNIPVNAETGDIAGI
jgi:hypothetical protein